MASRNSGSAERAGKSYRSLSWFPPLRSALKSPEELARAILSFGTVAVSVPDFADRFHVSLERLDRLVTAAEQAGLVVVMDDPHGPHQNLLLTPLAAFRLKVKLDWNSERWWPWRTRFTNERKRKRHRRHIDVSGSIDPQECENLNGMDFVDLAAQDPTRIAIVSEQISRFDRDLRRARIDDTEPKPARARRIINLGRPWPIVGPCCEGIDLKWGEYCAWCDRSGPDPLIGMDEIERQRSEQMRRIRDGENPPSPLDSPS